MSEYIITDEQIAENRRLHGKKLLVMPVIVRCLQITPDGFCAWEERRTNDN